MWAKSPPFKDTERETESFYCKIASHVLRCLSSADKSDTIINKILRHVERGGALWSEGFTVTGGATLSGGKDTESFISCSEDGLRVCWHFNAVFLS